jgi:UDPglucose--hexose-1-phosphate uridylyltransferase
MSTGRPRVHTTSISLADGRELTYFDRLPGADRSRADPRPLEPTHTTSGLRRDPLTDEWVTIASHRQSRTYLPAHDECPLCPSTPARATEIPAFDYEVVVFENRFPSFARDASAPGAIASGDPEGPAPFVVRPGLGRCEVVCFTSDHDSSFAQLTPMQAATVLEAWTQRTEALAALPGIAYVFVFENRGIEIGVTLAHPHGQIYAYSFVPPHAGRMLEVAARHRGATGSCLGCDVAAEEVADGRRLVGRTAHWVAYVPFAARWPFEVHLSPMRHMSTLVDLDGEEREELCGLYLEVLRRLDALFGVRMPYIAGFHQAPVGAAAEDVHLSMQLFSVRRAADKLKFLAGSESGQGAFINDIAPEQAAEMLREVTLR